MSFVNTFILIQSKASTQKGSCLSTGHLFVAPITNLRLSTKKWPHTLHRRVCLSIQTCANYSLNTLALINGENKNVHVATSVCYLCVLLISVLMTLLIAYRFPRVGSLNKGAEVHPIFSRQICTCMHITKITHTLCIDGFMYSYGRVF